MKNQLEQLYLKSQKKEKLIIGLMSGTSMDGLDIALCKFKGFGLHTNIDLLQFKTAPYSDVFKQHLKSIFSKREVDLEMVCLMNEQVARVHADLVNQALNEWGYQVKDIDFIASHGQTIYHAPFSLHRKTGLPNGTLQIGDGDHLAYLTQIITLSDFRQKHIAAGGEGAPLAVYGDYLLFSKKSENRILLNIGGISNFTFLPSNLDASTVFSTDVGAGNTLMDQYVQKYFSGKFYDINAEIASSGQCNDDLLAALLNHSFFDLPLPKSTGPELFSLLYLKEAIQESNTHHLSHEDVMATLCRFTAKGIARAVNAINVKEKLTIYQSGGGLHNPLLQSFLKEELPHVLFYSTADLGINPDAKEAVLFALLANETLTQHRTDFGNRFDLPSICMGKISLP